MKKILVPVDGSDHATLASVWAGEMAAAVGAEVSLLHVYAIPTAEAMGMAQLSREELKRQMERRAEPFFSKAKSAMGSAGAAVKTLAVVGDPAEEIIGIARSQPFDHIAMGSRGLSPVGELLLGSVSDKVIRHASCAVTIVR